jgi:hypothetical protein
MKKIILIAACLPLFLVAAPAVADPILVVTPAATEVVVGSTVDVTVSITGLMGEGVGDYDLALFFNEDVLDFLNVDFFTFLDGPADSLQFFFDFFGEVDVVEISFGFLFGQDGLSSFDLFTVSFDVVDVGVSSLDLGVFAIGDFFGFPLNAGVQNSSVTAVAATTVPEPGTIGLFALGLFGLLLSRRRLPLR